MHAPYILMAGGQEQPLLGPGVTYDVRTIAHHLAQLNRFTGAAFRPYSVAEHSLLCESIAADTDAPPALRLACLLHDAHEAVVSDVSTPVKRVLGRVWAEFESDHAQRLRAHLGVAEAFRRWAQEVHAIDRMALAIERRDLLPDASIEWADLDGVPITDWSVTAPWRAHRDWSEWRDEFIQRYHDLKALCE